MSSIADVSSAPPGASERPAPSAPQVRPTRPARPLRLRIHSAVRWLHIYTSMVSLLAVLFFSATGLTLNHPDWIADQQTRELTGKMPAMWKADTTVDWLTVAEYLRNSQGVHGAVADRRTDDREATITFKAPGYAADCTINNQTGEYRLTVSYQGAVGVLNDLHRGRDAGSVWASLIDVSAVFLVVVSATGIGLLFYLKKVRLRALLTMSVASAIVVLLAMLVAP